jgi:DNA replication protein DnaD
MKISLPGQETITLAGQTVDKLLRTGDGDAALLYLYILKTRGQSTSQEAAAALNKSAGGIATAMALLSRLGLINLDDNTAESPPAEPVFESAEGPHRYTLSDVQSELEAGSAFSSVVEETQRSLGKILSPDDLLRLFGIYDTLRLPPEVILQLTTHCITESRRGGSGRMPSMRYIEKAAYTWEREGIFTLDRAEEYLKNLEMRKSARGEIKNALQIRDRELSSSEKRYVDGWITMGFEADAVEIAYDRTVLQTGKLSWGYMDSIIKSWHGNNLRTTQEIMEKDGRSGKNANASVRTNASVGKKSPEQRFGAPDQEEIERMQRILQKIKEE